MHIHYIPKRHYPVRVTQHKTKLKDRLSKNKASFIPHLCVWWPEFSGTSMSINQKSGRAPDLKTKLQVLSLAGVIKSRNSPFLPSCLLLILNACIKPNPHTCICNMITNRQEFKNARYDHLRLSSCFALWKKVNKAQTPSLPVPPSLPIFSLPLPNQEKKPS